MIFTPEEQELIKEQFREIMRDPFGRQILKDMVDAVQPKKEKLNGGHHSNY